MKQKFLFFLAAFLCSQLIYAQVPTITNDENTITVASPWGCIPTGAPSNGPSVTGNYIVRVEWTDLISNTTESYQSTSAGDLLTVMNAGISSQSIRIDAFNYSGYTTSTLNGTVQYFPDAVNEGYALSDIADATTITIKTLDLSTTWIIKFSFGQKIEECLVVPVTLLSFTGQKVGNAAQLVWQTASEYNMSRYEIERSTDGLYFQTIGATVPSVNSSTTHTYSYTDNIPAAARQYYRLRMVDIDGRRKYSNIIYVQGFTAVAQPGSITCNYTMAGTNGLCSSSTGTYSLSTYPDFSNVTWTANPFYAIPNSYRLYANNYLPGDAKLTVINANVITLTATVSRCSAGGTIVKYIFKGKPAINTSVVSQTTTNPCSGAVISNSKTITVIPFPGTVAANYEWYLNNSYVGTGLTNSFTNSSTQVYNYEVRFNGPCGISLASGSIDGVATGGCTAPNIVVTNTFQSSPSGCGGGTTTSQKVTITPFACTTGSDYQWYINNSYNGTGLSRTFNTTNGQSYSYEIRYYGPCGLSTYTGYIGLIAYKKADMFSKVAPNPVVKTLTIERVLPCEILPKMDPSSPFISNKVPGLITSIEIFDYSGNLVKAQKFKTQSISVQVDVQNIKRGNYRLKINYGDMSEVMQIKLVD